MQQARWGRIVNVSSPTVTIGRQNYLHYVTSKSAAIGMTRAMARELGPWNITVHTFWPGVLLTEVERPSVSKEQFEAMTKLQSIPRAATTEDHARAVLFLCSEEASFITGQNIQSDGGRTFL
jgi:3-oxoacyl-[acyl-carrier protein] reductase